MSSLSRREFLKLALAAAVTARIGGKLLAAAGSSAVPAPTSAPSGGELPRRVLGKTNEKVTILGLGCGWIGNCTRTKGPDSEVRSTPVTPEETAAMVKAAYEGGIRYFDTSPDYLNSEARLGPAIEPFRKDIFLVSKVNFGATHQKEVDEKTNLSHSLQEDLDRSLELLKTDHLDLLLLHCLDQRPQTTPSLWNRANRPKEEQIDLLGKGGALEFLVKARKAGRVRFIGISVHANDRKPDDPFADTIAAISGSDEWDVIMTFVNPVGRAKWDFEGKVVAPAVKKNIGIAAMKVLGGDGQFADDYDRFFRYSLSVPGVATAVVGVSKLEEVHRAIKAARDFRPLNEGEMAEMIALGKKNTGKTAAMLHRHNDRDHAGVQLA